MKKFLSAFLFALLFFKYTFAQAPFFQQYFLLRKNEPVQVNTIFQDKSRFIWCGTNKGLFKFDGIKQQRFTTTDQLPDENVTAIAEDSIGRIWIGHKNGGIAYIEKGVIKKFEPAEGSSSKEVSDIIFDKKGNLWFSTLGDGLYYFTQDRLFRLDENEKIPDIFIYDLVEDLQGNIWAGTDGGVAICTLKDKAIDPPKILNYENGLPDNIIKKLVADIDGTMWMLTDEAGIIHYDPASGKYKSLLEGKWRFGVITDFLLSGSEVWISCLQKGLVIVDRKTEKTKLYDAQTSPGLASVLTLLEDYEGSIWAGTKTGMMRTPGDYIEYIETFGPAKDVNIMALAEDKQGTIWFSNSEGLFKRSVDKSGMVFTERQFANTPFQQYTVSSLYVDQDGYIWAGLYGEGVVRMNIVTGKTRYLNKELKDGNVLNISGKGDVVWLATLGGGTQIKISGEQLRVKNYNGADGLITDYIYQVFTDSKNRVWFATDGKGVDMMDETGFHHYKEGLNSKVVYGFAEDHDHQIWANVQGEGLYKFDGEKFRTFSDGNPFRSKNIHCLSSDKYGNLVVMHDLGIDIYDVTKNKIYSLGDEVGIHDKIPNLNAVSGVNKGRILFGTDRGIVVYSDVINHRLATPLPLVEKFKVLDKTVDLIGDLRFKYNENDVTISYLGFWYQDPENLHFEYKLENHDRDWIVSRNHFVTYSSLPPGEYIFKLRVSDTPEFRESKETTLRFIIRPPFWRTTGFYILSIVTGILLGYAFIKYREGKLQRTNKILEAKNAELKKTNMELDKFVYSVSHDLRAPLSSMLGVVEISEEETKDPLQLEHLGMLKGSINRLDGFIQDILEYSRNSRMEIKKEEIDFKKILQDITNNLKYMSNNNRKAEIRMNINDTKPFFSDKSRITIVLNNLISNAIRYQNPKTNEPFVNIKVDTSGTEIHIVVEDNGIGISKDLYDKIFDMFYRVSENSIGSGLGLYIVKETIVRLNGRIDVKSEPEKGTAISIHLPNN